MYGYKIDENESTIFSTKKDYMNAISDLKKQGFEKNNYSLQKIPQRLYSFLFYYSNEY